LTLLTALWVTLALATASSAHAQSAPPGQAQDPAQGGLNFQVEVNTPGASSAPLAPAHQSPDLKPGAVNSPVPPEPPKLGRPASPDEDKPPTSPKPLTKAEIEAIEARENILGELDVWRDSVNKGYIFSAVKTMDPFMPVESVARPPEKANTAVKETRPMIQQLALNQFTLSAIIVADNPDDNMALVDSGGKGYIIYKGTLIGNNYGKVREITNTKVIIEEPESTYRSSAGTRVTEIRLNSVRDSEGLEIFPADD
jgi:Tfp pilus assembly protein PilP